jgi:hypothetical protein
MEALIYWWRLRKLQLARRKTEEMYDRLIDAAKVQHGPRSHKVETLSWERQSEDEIHVVGIAKLQGNRLLAETERLMLPPPDYADDATWHDGESRWGALSRETIAHLRSRLRREQHEASQTKIAWLSAVTGLGGVIVAIIALLLKGGG